MFKWAFEGCMGHGWDWLHDARGQVSLGKPEPIHTNVYTRIFKIPPNRSFAPPCPRTTICANARLYHQNPECSMVFVLELFPFNRLSRSRRRKEKKKKNMYQSKSYGDKLLPAVRWQRKPDFPEEKSYDWEREERDWRGWGEKVRESTCGFQSMPRRFISMVLIRILQRNYIYI